LHSSPFYTNYPRIFVKIRSSLPNDDDDDGGGGGGGGDDDDDNNSNNNHNNKLYWNRSILTDKTIPFNRPDITFMNKKTKTPF